MSNKTIAGFLAIAMILITFGVYRTMNVNNDPLATAQTITIEEDN